MSLEKSLSSQRTEEIIQNLQTELKMSLDTLTTDNWQEVFTNFVGKLKSFEVKPFHEPLLKGWSARLLEKAYYLCRKNEGGAAQFALEIEELLKRRVKLPDFFTKTGDVMIGKRQPSFIESIDATLERFAFIEKLPEAFAEFSEALIVGGSMSYGPFFNIRENLDNTGSSDIDTLVVSKNPIEETSSSLDLFNKEDRRSFLSRVGIFNELVKTQQADILSHRFSVPGKDFTLSAHFFSLGVLNKMLIDQLAIDLKRNENKVFTVLDYKVRPFEHPACDQQSFDGSEYHYRVPKPTPVTGGFITSLPGYIINKEKFYPGLYQNLISPEFSVFYDATGQTSNTVGEFNKLISARLMQERANNPEAFLTRSHTRSKIFAPDRYEN